MKFLNILSPQGVLWLYLSTNLHNVMKKFLPLLAAMFIALGAHAEGFHIGGNLGIWRNSTDKVTSVTITPEVAYSISDQWLVGTTIGYKYTGYDHSHNSSFVLNPYGRYNYYKSGILGLFVDGGVDLALGRTAWDGGHSKTSAAFGIGFKPGISLDITPKFTFVAHLGFLGYQGCNKAAELGGFKKGFGFDFSNGLDFGLHYNF